MTSSWTERAASAFEGGPELGCAAGHATHPTYPVGVALGGRQYRIPDYPAVALRLATRFWVNIYDWRELHSPADGGFCPGADIVSEAIETLGIWEPYGTLLALDILAPQPETWLQSGVVVDLGSQVGWYSMIALANGWRTLAVDACPDSIAALEASAKMNGPTFSEILTTVRGTIGPGTPKPVYDPTARIRLWKCDVEGHEDDAVMAFTDQFVNGLIDYALIEVFPTFADPARPGGKIIARDYYPELVRWIVDEGYRAYHLPTDKASETTAAWAASPLDAVEACRVDDLPGLEEWVAGCYQADMLFAREDLRP